MSTNKKNIIIDSGITLFPQASAPATAEGNIYNLNSDTSIHAFIQSADRIIATLDQSQIFSNKTISGSANTITNVSLTTAVTGILPIANGGTNANTKAAAFDNLSPMSALGDIIYGGTSGTNTRLTGNTTTTKQFLTQTGNGSVSAAPVWGTIANTDLSGITNTQLSGSAAISNANLASMATLTIKGNVTGGSAIPTDLTATQATSILNNFVGDSGSGGTKGLVPAPAAGDAAANKFLKANGSWAVATVNAANPVGKNYFVTNSANNNFSSGSASPWSVFNTTFTAAGVPQTITLSATNVTVPITSTNPLLASQSANNLQMVKTANNSQGQGFISTAMTIDREDLAKVLYGSFSYEVVSGTVDFSGTSTQSLEIWIYNVTAAAWIQPSGYRGMNQSIGQGLVTFNFQTDSTAANNSYQIAVILRQTDANATTVNFNDFTLGPKSIVLGTPVTDWISYTPTYSAGFGTVTNNAAKWRRVGDSIEIKGTCTTGTVAGSLATITLPNGYTIDTTKITLGNTTATEGAHVGDWIDSSSGNQEGPMVTATGTSTSLLYLGITTAANQLIPKNGNATVNSTTVFSFKVLIPILGFSSNVQMSSDTDTRIVSAVVNTSTTAGTTSQNFIFTNIVQDTHGGYNASTGKYTVPVSGTYRVSSYVSTNVSNKFISVRRNGSIVFSGNNVATNVSYVSGTWPFVTGDTIDIIPSVSDTANGVAANTYMMIERLTGPSVVSATETIAASYYMSTNQNGTTGTPYNFDTKEYDTHGAVTTGASWAFTAPATGIYDIRAFGGNVSSAATVYFSIYKNGTIVKSFFVGNANIAVLGGSTSISLVAGDKIDIRPSTSFTLSGGTLSTNGVSSISIRRG